MQEIDPIAPLTQGERYESIDELRLSSPIEVKDVRERNSAFVDVAITIQPADICARNSLTITGTSRNLAPHRLLAICDLPVVVGSLFEVTLDRSVIDVDATLGLCDRCIMLSPTTFEVGFQFIHELDLPDPADAASESINPDD